MFFNFSVCCLNKTTVAKQTGGVFKLFFFIAAPFIKNFIKQRIEFG